MKPLFKRRQFLGTLSAATAGWALNLQAQDARPKIKMGLIGCGWYGMLMMRAALKTGEVECVALCDVDSDHLEKSAVEIEKLQGRRPKTHKHYPELLSTPGMESVLLATPPQWHALPFIAACQKKLDLYCEKPLAYDVREGQAMVEAAQQSGQVVQIGFQRRQSETIRQAAQHIREGNPGRIVQVDAQIHYGAKWADTKIQDPPATLDWDLWCGPAPKLPYRPSIGHFNWRLEKEYGNGHLVDWGIHWIDSIRTILGLGMPQAVVAAGGNYASQDKCTTPDTLSVHFEFEQCPVVWRHRIWGANEFHPELQNGMFFFGEKETLFVSDNKWVVMGANGKVLKTTEVSTDSAQLHMMDFVRAVRSRQAPSCLIEDAFKSTATVQLAMISLRSGTRVRWDAVKHEIIDNPAAGRFLKRDYRAPWKHPYRT
jgi:predicted dehydrogenase